MKATVIVYIFVIVFIRMCKSQPDCTNINATFPINMDNTVCHGLYNVPSAKTYQACAQACCNQTGCEIYQFSPSSSACWMGGMDYCTSVNGWLSRARVEPATSHIWPLPQQYTFSDTANIYINPESFTFDLDSSNSDIMNTAILRYKSLIFSHTPESKPTNTIATISSLSIKINDYNENTLQYGMDESYELNINSSNKQASLLSETIWGALKGLETFSQIVIFNYTERYYTSWECSIIDAPRFNHRGLMIDTSRHFQTVQSIHNFLDVMAYAKFNVLHWHITDSQSFPMESKLYPNLWRGSYSMEERFTQNDVLNVIKYAKYRGIRVVAEFDIPGHATSWCTGYPSICPSPSCKSPLNPASNMTWELLEGFIGNEMLNLFPDNFMHLGGDEVNTNCWENTPSIVTWMNENNFTTPRQALQYFDERAQSIVYNNRFNKTKTVINWVEVYNMFNNTLDKNHVIIQVWKAKAALKSVVESGFRGILSDNDLWYLSGSKHLTNTWQMIYMNEPYENIDDQNAQKLIIGGEACLWGETIDVSNLQTITWPRAAAVAERLWSPQYVNDTQAALPRISYFRCLLSERGVQAPLINNPQAGASPPQPGSCYALYERRRRRL